MKDGQITKEEREILTSVNENNEIFLQSLNKVMEDNIITKEENILLNKLYDNIYDQSEKIAKQDYQISPDEYHLLMRIIATIKKKY